jgi:hypothetical protein
VNDTLSTPDPAHQVYDVRRIIRERGDHSCEATLLAIRRVVDPPPAADAPPTEHDDRGWPELRANEERHDPGGTAWERHDEPHGDEPGTTS